MKCLNVKFFLKEKFWIQEAQLNIKSGCMAGRMHVLIESIATVMRFTSDKIQLITQKI